MPLVPFFSDLYPLPQPVAPLKLVPCPECQGETECSRCGESAVIEVCSECLEPYGVVLGQEVCGCTFPRLHLKHEPCELCQYDFPAAELNDAGICKGCHLMGSEWLEAERVKYVSDAQEEFEWAIRSGLCAREQIYGDVSKHA